MESMAGIGNKGGSAAVRTTSILMLAPREPRYRGASVLPWAAASGVTAVVSSAGLCLAFRPTFITLAVLAYSALCLYRPQWTVSIFVVVTWAVRPSFVPDVLTLGHHQLYFDELAVIPALLYAWKSGRSSRTVNVLSLLFGLTLVSAAILGVIHSGLSEYVDDDFRGPAMLLACFWIAARVARLPEARNFLRVVVWVLWWSAAITALASATGFSISATTSNPVLFSSLSGLSLTDAVSGAVRFQSVASSLALCVSSGTIALLIVGRVTIRAILPYLFPALVILLLGFARNSLLGLGVAVLFAVVTGRFRFGIGKSLRRIAGTTLILAALAGALMLGPLEPWLHAQVSAFDDRVVHGLSASVRSTDESVAYRSSEDQALVSAIDTSPLLGHGFGFVYKQPYGPPESFTAGAGSIYAHNFYLWDLAKSGVIGLLAFTVLSVSALFRTRRGGELGVAVGAAAAALLAVSVVAPAPEDPTSAAPALGAVLGCLMAAGWSFRASETLKDTTRAIRVSKHIAFAHWHAQRVIGGESGPG